MPNLDIFNKYAAEIFAAAYASFPLPAALTYQHFGCELTDAHWMAISSPESVSIMKQRELVDSTVAFLVSNGYLSGCTASQDDIRGICLTEKALLALNLKPDSLGDSKSLGDKIIEAVKSGTPETIGNTLTSLLTAGITLLMK